MGTHRPSANKKKKKVRRLRNEVTRERAAAKRAAT
jgi:hypothetical protein